MTTTPFDWSAVAEAWEASRAQTDAAQSPVADAIASALAPRPGQRLLELGAGTGDLARRLAGLVQPGGSVLATDVAAGMVDVAARTLADVPGATVQWMDATSVQLPDGSVDAVAFQMGLMFVPEPTAAAREIARVLVPGGRAAVATWAAPEHNPWLVCLGMAAAMQGVVAGGPPTEPGGLFSLSTADALRDVLASGGLLDVRVQEVPITMVFRDPDDYATHLSSMAGPLAAAIAAAPDKAPAVRATAAELVGQYVTPEGVAVPGLALVATATR